MPQTTTISYRKREERCRCHRGGLDLAERFRLAVAVVDLQANIVVASPAVLNLLKSHPALLTSSNRIGLLSSGKSQAFRITLRRVLSSDKDYVIRADDGCVSAPLGLHISPWHCPNHCLVSFHVFEAQPTDFARLADVFDLTPRQLGLLKLFSEGLSLADIADRTRLKPQTVREAFSHLYVKFEVRSQLELMSVLAAIGTLGTPP